MAILMQVFLLSGVLIHELKASIKCEVFVVMHYFHIKWRILGKQVLSKCMILSKATNFH